MASKFWLIATIAVALVGLSQSREASAQRLKLEVNADESDEPASETSPAEADATAAALMDEQDAQSADTTAASDDESDGETETAAEPSLGGAMPSESDAADESDNETSDESDNETSDEQPATLRDRVTADEAEDAEAADEQPGKNPFGKADSEAEPKLPRVKRPLVAGPYSKPTTNAAQGQAHRNRAPHAARDPNAARPINNDGKEIIAQAFGKTKSANNEATLTEIIALCQTGLEAGLPKENAGYARRLMAWAHNRRGEVRADAGSDADAREDFETAATLDPKHWRAVHNRGVSFAAAGNLDAAIADFDRTLQMNPKFANGYFNRGELRYDRGEFTTAIADYTEAIRLNPKDTGAYNSRGHANYRLNLFRAALADYSSAIRIDPANAAAYTNRGDAYADLGSYAEAVKDYQMAVKINPRLGRAYQSAAWLMATCPDSNYRDDTRALEIAQKAIELDGDDQPLYLETLAAAQANAGQFPEATETQQKAVKLVADSDHGRAKSRLALYQKGSPFRDSVRSGATATAPRGPQRPPQR